MEMEKLRRRGVKPAAAALVVLGMLAAARFWYLEEQGNFHTITPGEAYRSAQMDADELEYYIHRFDIRSIINLRGEKPVEPWYKEEIEICRKFGIRHYSLGLNAEAAPSSEQIDNLLRIYAEAERPVLIHCKAGADRAGLAAALWKIIVNGMPKFIAREQLSIRFGHMPFGPTQVLDSFLEDWKMPEGGTATGPSELAESNDTSKL